MSNPELITGTVKWFNAEKGFGFISTADHGDVFVHVRALAEGLTALTVGEPVYFSLRQAEKGPEAANVRAGMPPPPPKPALPTVELRAGLCRARQYAHRWAAIRRCAGWAGPGSRPAWWRVCSSWVTKQRRACRAACRHPLPRRLAWC